MQGNGHDEDDRSFMRYINNFPLGSFYIGNELIQKFHKKFLPSDFAGVAKSNQHYEINYLIYPSYVENFEYCILSPQCISFMGNGNAAEKLYSRQTLIVLHAWLRL